MTRPAVPGCAALQFPMLEVNKAQGLTVILVWAVNKPRAAQSALTREIERLAHGVRGSTALNRCPVRFSTTDCSVSIRDIRLPLLPPSG
jgi:hypothetical protein